MPSLKHLHTYKRFKKSSKISNFGGAYKCIHPECTHFVLDHNMIAGKKAMCKCGNAFIIEPQFHFKRTELKCFGCSKAKQTKAAAIASDVMNDALSSPFQAALDDSVLKIPHEVKQLELLPGYDEETIPLDLGNTLDDFDA